MLAGRASSTFARCLLDVCYAVCMLHICSMFARSCKRGITGAAAGGGVQESNAPPAASNRTTHEIAANRSFFCMGEGEGLAAVIGQPLDLDP